MMHETNNDRSVLSPSIWAKQTIFFVLGFFLMVSPLYPQEKSGSGQEPAAMVSSKKKEAQKDMTALEKKSLAAVSQEVEEIQKETALPPVVQDEEALFASDIDSQKAMENVLQEVILKDMQTYYPSIRSITLESDDESSTLEITYDQSSSQDKLQIKTNLIK